MAETKSITKPLSILFYLLFIFISVPAQSTSTNNIKQDSLIKVGSYHCPPFVIHENDEDYTGLTILLWEQIAKSLNLQYEIKQYPLTDLLDAVAEGKINIGISCISITPEREERLDFSHSFYETHLAIAVKKQGYLASIINILTNKKLLLVLAILLCAAALIGSVFYFIENKVNDKLYSMQTRLGRFVEGFILGLLFITKGPFNYFEFKTLSGRVLTVIIAIFSTLFIASITAVLASTFTLGLLNSDIKNPNDLANIKTGAKKSSTSSQFLTNHSIVHQAYNTVEDMLVALEKGEIEAVIADDPVLKYQIKKAKERGVYTDMIVLPYQFEKQNYGFAIEDSSPYAEELNRALLKIRQSNEWRQALNKYFTDIP